MYKKRGKKVTHAHTHTHTCLSDNVMFIQFTVHLSVICSCLVSSSIFCQCLLSSFPKSYSTSVICTTCYRSHYLTPVSKQITTKQITQYVKWFVDYYYIWQIKNILTNTAENEGGAVSLSKKKLCRFAVLRGCVARPVTIINKDMTMFITIYAHELHNSSGFDIAVLLMF